MCCVKRSQRVRRFDFCLQAAIKYFCFKDAIRLDFDLTACVDDDDRNLSATCRWRFPEPTIFGLHALTRSRASRRCEKAAICIAIGCLFTFANFVHRPPSPAASRRQPHANASCSKFRSASLAIFQLEYLLSRCVARRDCRACLLTRNFPFRISYSKLQTFSRQHHHAHVACYRAFRRRCKF